MRSKTNNNRMEEYAVKRVPLFSWFNFALTLTFITAARAAEPTENTIVALDAKRQTVTAINVTSGKLFKFVVKDAGVFKSAKLCETFEAPVAEMQKDTDFAADFGSADPKAPCCTLTTEIGGAGQALGMRPYEVEGVDVILTELKRTAGETVTARWQYCNGGERTVRFKPQGCTGMGCTYTLTEGMHLLDGATRMKLPVMRDTRNKAIAQHYTEDKLAVGPHRVLATWAKFPAPPASSGVVTVVMPGVNEPFEDVPIGE